MSDTGESIAVDLPFPRQHVTIEHDRIVLHLERRHIAPLCEYLVAREHDIILARMPTDSGED